MTDVYFFDYGTARDYISGIKFLFKKAGLDNLVPKAGSVAVKTHMGDMGSTGFIKPSMVRTVVDLIKEKGGKLFVTDTSVVYPGGRGTPERYLETAAYNGFVEKTVGAPVIIADENNDPGVRKNIDQRLGECKLEEVKVASKIYHADALAVLSHVKGHGTVGGLCSGALLAHEGYQVLVLERLTVLGAGFPPGRIVGLS